MSMTFDASRTSTEELKRHAPALLTGAERISAGLGYRGRKVVGVLGVSARRMR